MMKDNKGSGKVVAIVIVAVLVLGLIVFFVMGAIKKSKGGPGGLGGPGQGPGGPGQGPNIIDSYNYSDADILSDYVIG